MTTGTFNTICVQECGLLREYAGCRRPEMVLVGTDLALSLYAAPSLPLAMMILLPILGQEHWMSYLTDNVSVRHIICFSEPYYAVVAQLSAIHRSGWSSKNVSSLQPKNGFY